MLRSTRSLPLLLAAALIAGCGGSSTSSSDAPDGGAAPKQAAPANGNGSLKVGATGADIGKAITGTDGGIETLPDTPVPAGVNGNAGVGAGASCADKEVVPDESNMRTVVTATLCLLNGERADAGLTPLTQNDQLAQAAVAHSDAMVSQQFFDHTGKDGSTPVDRIRSTGYIPSSGAWTVGENLAWGTGSLATPKEIVTAWMKSQGHRENILRAGYKEIGFGVVVGNPRSRTGKGATFTTTFGGLTRAAGATKKTSSKKKVRKVRRARRARASRARGSR